MLVWLCFDYVLVMIVFLCFGLVMFGLLCFGLIMFGHDLLCFRRR